MLTWWKRRQRRRALSPIVTALPRLLAHRFGAKDAYTAKQVASALETLRIAGDPERAAMAHALACEAEEFSNAFPEDAANRRRELRATLGDIFRLSDADLGLRRLRQSRVRSAFQSADADDWNKLGSHGGRNDDGP